MPNEERATKGKIIADALISLSSKYPDDEDVAAAIATILSVNMGFDIPDSGEIIGGSLETAEIEEEEVMAEVRRMVSRGMRRLNEGSSEYRLKVVAVLPAWLWPYYALSPKFREKTGDLYDDSERNLKNWLQQQEQDLKAAAQKVKDSVPDVDVDISIDW